ncbi:MAG: type VI secretion system protein ImpA [Cellvibrionaceae bacterium]|jgi:type VI secretion system protein ImpA
MASDDLIDIQSLLAPISDQAPAGQDTRQDRSPNSAYQTIKNARNSARAAERSNMFDGTSSEATENWRTVIDLAPDLIKNHSKDLEIATWYIEALVRRHGFQGLRDGFKLVLGLVEQYWDNLCPMPDEDGIESRIAPLAGLNGEGSEGVLVAPIRNIFITEGQSPGPFSFWKYQQAREIQRLPDEDARQQKAANLGFSQEDVDKAVLESSELFFVNLRDDVQICIETYTQLSRLLDEHCGNHIAPPTSNIINALKESLGAINHLGGNKFPVEPERVTEDLDATSQDENSAPTAQALGSIGNREIAFKQLNAISDFFRKTEPHSPISYVLEKAVKWGDMPLSDLILELIPDPSSREHYGTLTGVKTQD